MDYIATVKILNRFHLNDVNFAEEIILAENRMNHGTLLRFHIESIKPIEKDKNDGEDIKE